MTAEDLEAGGMLMVDGNLDLSGFSDKVEITEGSLDRETTYTIVSYGTLTGEFDSINIGTHIINYDGPENTIQLVPRPSKTVIVIR